MIILKVTKNQSFTISLEDTFLEKRQGRQMDPPVFLVLRALYTLFSLCLLF